MKTLTEFEAADALLHTLFLRYGLPKHIRSDNGTQIVNATISTLCITLGVNHHRIIAGEPQYNGITERGDRQALLHLRCLTYEMDVL